MADEKIIIQAAAEVDPNLLRILINNEKGA